MRKAGDLIREYLREGKLNANRSEPIGAGQYGVVYESDVEGNVMKQLQQDYVHPHTGLGVTNEANLQAIAAELGMAPRLAGVETFPGGVGNRIEMSDVRPNFEHHYNPISKFPTGRDAVRVNQQLGQLALKGVRLEDRHNSNVVYNKQTGRPMHLDFGIAGRVEGSEKVATLTNATAEGFESAGLIEEAAIYRATVMDLLEGGDVTDAMDVAKQGFSRLQKIKGPLGRVPTAATALYEQDLARFDDPDREPAPMFNAVTKQRL